ncbi:hypothetical protein LINGRAHAP2_LOCUS27890 [Linum grandiflorum]
MPTKPEHYKYLDIHIKFFPSSSQCGSRRSCSC